MRKITQIVFTITLLFSLIACGNDQNNDNDPTTITTNITIQVAQETTWTPFSEATDFFFEVEDQEILEVSNDGTTLFMKGLIAGETLIFATNEEEQSVAHVTVKEVTSTATKGSVLWWVEYFECELLSLNKEQQTEYLLEVGDYMALAMPAKQFDHEFVNMAQAATLLYPSSYMINNYASLQQDMGQYEEAKRWYEKALEIDSNNPVILTNLAHTEYELENYTRAMELAGKAIQAEPDYGLAYLVMTCVHLENGDDMLAIETLFKSLRSTYTETTSDLLRDLYRQVRTQANMTSSTNYDKVVVGMDNFIDLGMGEMILTEYHIELLFEALGASSQTNGQDTPTNQISLPYPADPEDAVLGPEAWESAASAVNDQIEEILESIEGYTVGNAELEEREAWCLAFLQTYYEYQIFKIYETLYKGISFEETGERGVDAEHEEYTLANMNYDVDDTLHKIFIDNWNTVYRAEMGTRDQIDFTADTPAEYQLMIQYYQSQVAPCDQAVVAYATRRKEMYEEYMRPLLEEYWLKMNAMLGYVENEHVRDMYGKRLIATINREAYVNTLYHAYPLGISTGDENLEMANYYRAKLGQALYEEEYQKAKRNDARILDNKTEDGQLQDFNQDKETPLQDIVITIPPLSPVQVTFGMHGDKFMYGYGAFGNDIIKEYDLYTGEFSETIITKTSVLPEGLGELGSVISDIKDVLEAGSGKEFLLGKINPIGNIPMFDRTKGEGTTYTYDSFGRLINVTKIKEDTIGGSWGPIGASQTTTTSKSSGYMSSPWNSETKTNLSFGIVTVGY